MPELDGVRYARDELLRRVGRIEQVAGVRLVTLEDGAERGGRVLEFRTESGFEFDVVVDRGFDIGRCQQAGRSLAWTSRTGFAGPWFFEPEGLGFLCSFGGGLLTTCGLVHAFSAAEDTVEQYHYPAKSTERYGLHGRVSNRPARLGGIRRAVGRGRAPCSTPSAMFCRRRCSASSSSSAAGSRRGWASRDSRFRTRSSTSATRRPRTCSSTT